MISRIYPPLTGGPGSVTSNLSKELVRKGIKVYVVTQHVKRAKFHEEKDGVEIYRVPLLKIPGISQFNTFTLICGAISLALATLYVLKKFDIDIIHIQDISLAGIGGLLLALVSRRIFIFKYGGDLVFEYVSLKILRGNLKPDLDIEKSWKLNDFRVKILYWIQRQYTKRFDYLIPDSYYGAELLRKMGAPEDKINVILNGVDAEKFSPEVDSTFIRNKMNLKGPVILTSARLIPQKGIDYLIKAAPFILEKFPETTFLIVGDGPDKTRLMKLVNSLSLEKNVLIIGNIPHDDMRYFVASADVFVLPSFYETIPNALLEAMSGAKPVIATSVGGVIETIQNRETGLLVPPGDVDAIKNAIIEILSNAILAKKMGINARKYILKNHDWQIFVLNVLRLYKHCIEEKKLS